MNTIPAYAIAACLAAAAKRDVRFYLNGVYVEEGAKPAIVGTDGHVLAALRSACGAWTLPSVIIPRDVCEIIAKWKGDVTFSETSHGAFRATCGGQLVEFSAIDGRFPDWRRGILKPEVPAVATFDPGVLAAAVKVVQVLRARCGDTEMRAVTGRTTYFGLSRLPGGIASGAIVAMPLRETYVEEPASPETVTA